MKGILKTFGIYAITIITIFGIATSLVSCDDAWANMGLTDENDVKTCLAENTNIVVGTTLHKGSAYVYVPHANLNKFTAHAVETKCGNQIITSDYQAYTKGQPIKGIDYNKTCPVCFEQELEQ